MDYIVKYSVDGEIKMEVVSFEDFITSDFIIDFILDKLYFLTIECFRRRSGIWAVSFWAHLS